MAKLQAAYRVKLDSLSLDAYKDALEGRSIDRLPEVVNLIVQEEKFFPPAATIINYFRRLDPIRAALPEGRPEDYYRTPEQKCRLHLILEYSVFNPNKADDLEAAKANLSTAGMEQYIRDNWSRGMVDIQKTMRDSGRFTSALERI